MCVGALEVCVEFFYVLLLDRGVLLFHPRHPISDVPGNGTRIFLVEVLSSFK
jgi:hypothetical protein